jgi:hypothetical protein
MSPVEERLHPMMLDATSTHSHMNTRFSFEIFALMICVDRLAVGVGWWHVAGPVGPQPVGRRPTERAGEEQQGAVGQHAKPLVEWAAPREVYQQVNGNLTGVTRTKGRQSADTRATGVASPSRSSRWGRTSTESSRRGTRIRTGPGAK